MWRKNFEMSRGDRVGDRQVSVRTQLTQYVI